MRFCGCKNAFRQYLLANADTKQIFACHCEERSDVAIRISLRQGMAEGSTSGKYVRRYEFAQSNANLLGFPAGKRIATGVRTGSQ